MSARICFIDVETLGTDPERHDLWEIGLISRTEDSAEDLEYLWEVWPDLSRADPGALRVNRYYERHWLDIPGNPDPELDAVYKIEAGQKSYTKSRAERVAAAVAQHTAGAVIAAANPAFDTAFLERFLRRHGHCPSWDYHLTDIGSLVLGWAHGRHAGYLDVAEIVRASHRDCGGVATGEPYPAPQIMPPLKLRDAAIIAGVDPERHEAHTALGDARLARDIYDAVTGGAR